MKPIRYAIYYLPPAHAEWTQRATAWLGWDCFEGRKVTAPVLDLPESTQKSVTNTPRRYGLHATLKPPFRLSPDHDEDTLRTECAKLAEKLAPIQVPSLVLANLGRFIALRPEGDLESINALAASCVTELDRFRAPATTQELEKRRKARLSPAQDTLLEKWGYPYVLDQFRFHITLTSRMDHPTREKVHHVLSTYLGPVLPSPFEISEIALVGEDEQGCFRHLQSYSLAL